MKILTWNSEYVFTIQREIHTIKGDNSRCIFFFPELYPFFDLQKTVIFVISLLLLKIFTWNSGNVSTIQRAIHTIKGDNSKCIFFFRIMPLFWLRLFILYQAPHSRALAPACCALDSITAKLKINYSCNVSELEMLKVFLPQTTNFTLFQVKRVCRRQFQIRWQWKKVLQMGRKHCRKRRNC